MGFHFKGPGPAAEGDDFEGIEIRFDGEIRARLPATLATGPWTEITGATTPHVLPDSEGTRFFRVARP